MQSQHLTCRFNTAHIKGERMLSLSFSFFSTCLSPTAICIANLEKEENAYENDNQSAGRALLFILFT